MADPTVSSNQMNLLLLLNLKEDVGYIHTMEYYSAIKKNEIMPSAATWMDLEIITLSKVSQTKTNTI